MGFFIFILCSGVWFLYNYATYFVENLPYIDLCTNGNFILEALHTICIKWSLPLGIMFVIAGLSGVVINKVDDNNLAKMKWLLCFVGLLIDIFLLF